MRSFCTKAISDKITELEKERNIQMMLNAANDPEYLARCKEIQNDFKHLDYSGGNEEW